MHHIYINIYILTVPDINWKGNAVLDFESWTTVWDLNIGEGTWHSKIYQNYSIQPYFVIPCTNDDQNL